MMNPPAATMLPTASASFTGAMLFPADRPALAAWSDYFGIRLAITADHERYPEMAELSLHRSEAARLAGSGVQHEADCEAGVLTFMAYRDAATGEAVVVGEDGLELSRGADMEKVLEGVLREA